MAERLVQCQHCCDRQHIKFALFLPIPHSWSGWVGALAWVAHPCATTYCGTCFAAPSEARRGGDGTRLTPSGQEPLFARHGVESFHRGMPVYGCGLEWNPFVKGCHCRLVIRPMWPTVLRTVLEGLPGLPLQTATSCSLDMEWNPFMEGCKGGRPFRCHTPNRI